MTEKPLHVKVAEALGQHVAYYEAGARIEVPASSQCWVVINAGEWRHTNGPQVRRYDTDWSATGPLIERYRLELLFSPESRTTARYSEADGSLICGADVLPAVWFAQTVGDRCQSALGGTPLIAACNLILDLKEAGLLKTATVALADRHNLRP